MVVFVEENIEELLESARATWKEPIVQEFLKKTRIDELVKVIGENFKVWPDDFIRSIDKSMKSYANCWAAASKAHSESGLYKKIVEAADIKSGLTVDLGCGSGGLLAELPDGWVGVDINNYSLQAAEQHVRSRGKSVERFSRSHISFDPDSGFILKPHPYLLETDFKKNILIADDLRTFQNTIRLLYNQGVKADTATFTMWGGFSNYLGVEFIDWIAKAWGKKEDNSLLLPERVLEYGPKICRQGGRLVFAVRTCKFEGPENLFAYDRKGRRIDVAEGLRSASRSGEEMIEKYKHLYELEDKGEIPVTVDENKFGLNVYPQAADYSQQETKELLDQVGIKNPPVAVRIYVLKVK